jgi:3-oxoacyl-(acyl-carrier-protein) synthase
LLAGTSGITTIDRFDAKEYPTRFGGQIRAFDDEKQVDCPTTCCVVPQAASVHA